MAPCSSETTTSQQLLAQAKEKVTEALKEVGGNSNEFAEGLLALLDVSKKIQEFDDMALLAQQETASEEAKQWKEISLLTMQHCRKHLEEQQKGYMISLYKLSEQGASIFKAPSSAGTMAELPLAVPGNPPPGLSLGPKPDAVPMSGVKAVSLPPGLSTGMQTVPGPTPPGLMPPPGLASAGNALRHPPGLGPASDQKSASKPWGKDKPKAAKKTWATERPWAAQYPRETKTTVEPKCQAFYDETLLVNEAVMNFAAYDSE